MISDARPDGERIQELVKRDGLRSGREYQEHTSSPSVSVPLEVIAEREIVLTWQVLVSVPIVLRVFPGAGCSIYSAPGETLEAPDRSPLDK